MNSSRLEKNQELTVEISDLTHDGNGVAKVEGYPIFIAQTLPGETAKIKVIKVKKNFAFGRLIKLEKVSSERVTPPCPVYSKCGGCQLQHLSYQAQLKFKQKQVKEVIKRIGKLDLTIHETLRMDDPFRYRNKSQVPVGLVNGCIQAGFYQKRSHRIIDMDTCLIQARPNDQAVQLTREILAKYNVPPYNEEQHYGDIRHIMTRSGFSTGEFMIVLITRQEDFPNKKAVINDLVAALGSETSITQNVNPHKTNVIFGEKTITLYGKDAIIDTIHGISFAISARSFYQVNSQQTEVLYQQALEAADLKGDETVIDAYCGIGSISLCLAQKARHVYGVEIIEQAVQDALVNANLNGIKNVTFKAGKAEEVIPNWYKKGIQADVFVVDPPRKGCDSELLRTMLEMRPEKIIYVSCDPATLARDLKTLTDGGYKARAVQPVDMFPMTTHVETITLLQRR